MSATTPPNALTGSASRAAAQASSSVGRSAAPHGFVCLTMTTPGPAQGPAERRRGRGVEDVVVREGLALERRPLHAEEPVGRRRPRPPVARRGLVRVLPVAQRLDLLERHGQPAPGTGRSRRAARARRGAPGRRRPCGPAARPRSGRRRRRCGRTPRGRGRAAARRRCRRARRARRGSRRSAPASVTIATLAWFLAAARTIDGPPMSISSISSSTVIPGRSSAAANG